jgi:hypothetical protein
MMVFNVPERVKVLLWKGRTVGKIERIELKRVKYLADVECLAVGLHTWKGHSNLVLTVQWKTGIIHWNEEMDPKGN